MTAADETVRRSVKALVQGRDMRREDVAAAVGIPRTTFYRRLAARGSAQAFTAGEVAALAAFFRVPVEELYNGLGGALLPRLDSNQEPAGLAEIGSDSPPNRGGFEPFWGAAAA